jgi:MYXO-CTERM domain-containing protein
MFVVRIAEPGSSPLALAAALALASLVRRRR